MKKVLSIVTGGPVDQPRARRLSAKLRAEVTFLDIDRSEPRRASSRRVRAALASDRWDLVYLEGTGVAGGLNLIRAARGRGLAFVVSSGDPIGGFFRTTKGPLWGWAFGLYERRLYRACAGFIGWTPYLTGMALALGAPRGVTVEGGVDLDVFQPAAPAARAELRRSLGLEADHLVCGIVGSLTWSPRQNYCYGMELVETLNQSRRADLSLLIVGDGTGRERLERAVRPGLRGRVRFTGRVPREEVARVLPALDIAFNAQTLDGLGRYRLTAKLPEYLACGVPVAMSPVPGFYDYVREAGWALPARHPASPEFARETAAWLDGLDRAEVARKAERARPLAEQRFDYERLSERFAEFVHDLWDGDGS
ncbi:MAG: glycosyltransferase [Isosphaeraceae bacterium]|nr:glycosyltransferase [Isosphaeraceae bacterium]